jgi:hypothetical protein
MIHLLRFCVLGSIVAICGCASSSAASSSDASQSDEEAGYEATLEKCRRLQPGRLNQRMNLPPTSLRVSACLRKRGWAPDGSRLD